LSTGFIQKNSGEARLQASMDYNWVRDITSITDAGIVFETSKAYKTYGSTTMVDNNLGCIPVAIYAVDVAPPNVDYTLTEEKDTKELLWENPNPLASFAAQTINLDLSEYDSLEIEFNMTINSPVKTSCIVSVANENQFLLTSTYGSASKIVGLYRTGTIYNSSISFRSGWTSNPTADTETNTSCVPYRIYGIKNKINVTTAVVTDKGQHTDLLWENASPNAEFAAQTIKIEGISKYSMIQVVAKDNISGNSEIIASAHVGKEGCLRTFWNYRNARNFKYDTSDNVWFGDGAEANYNATTYTANNSLIPIKIYGIKHNAATTSTIMGDYVVEEGASEGEGITWEYRKWNSGKAECWGRWSGSLTHYTTQGTMYAFYKEGIEFPFKFAELPITNFNATIGDTFTVPANSTYGLSTTAMCCYALCRNSGTLLANFDIQVKGRWK
jgi:hypothetical protein